VTHAPTDGPWVAEILAGLDPAPAVFSSPRLKEFAAMLAAARLVITCEGGPMHLSAAVGTPQVVLWGEDTPMEVWHPWEVSHTILGGRGPVSQIGLAEVLAAVERLTAGG